MLRLFSFVLVLVVTVAASAAHAKSDEPRSFSQLQRTLKGAPAPARIKTLEGFARDRRAALGDRLQATAALRRLLEQKDPRLLHAWMLEAHLQSVAQAESLRARALRNAKTVALAVGHDKTAKRLDEVLAGERALTKLVRVVEKREAARAQRPLSKAEEALRDEVTSALSSWRALKHVRSVGLARMWLARLDTTTPEGEAAAAKALADLVRIGGDDRDAAPLRAEVRRARARLLAKSGDLENAVHEMLVADRAMLVPPTLPRFEPPPQTRYGRTRETAELCFVAYQQGIHCSEIEEERMGGRSFYDFSREAPRRDFDEQRAQMVAAEYTPLLLDCIKEGVRDGSTRDTNIQLEWSIGHDGKVRGSQVNPRRLRKTPFEKCVKSAFGVFRYPPYRGEMKHMGNSFNVGE